MRETTKFPGLKLILRVDPAITQAGVASRSETRSLSASRSGDEVSPKRLIEWVRGQWSVENGLPFLKDRGWDEDRQGSRRPGLAERLTALRHATLTALRLIPGVAEDFPLRARADHLGRNLRKALNFIGAR